MLIMSHEEKEKAKIIFKHKLIGMIFNCINPGCRGGVIAGAGSQFDPATGECSGPPTILHCPMCAFGSVTVTEENYARVWQDALTIYLNVTSRYYKG